MSTLGSTMSFSLWSRKHVYFRSSTKTKVVLPICSDVDFQWSSLITQSEGVLLIPKDHLIDYTVIPDFFKTKIL